MKKSEANSQPPQIFEKFISYRQPKFKISEAFQRSKLMEETSHRPEEMRLILTLTEYVSTIKQSEGRTENQTTEKAT